MMSNIQIPGGMSARMLANWVSASLCRFLVHVLSFLQDTTSTSFIRTMGNERLIANLPNFQSSCPARFRNVNSCVRLGEVRHVAQDKLMPASAIIFRRWSTLHSRLPHLTTERPVSILCSAVSVDSRSLAPLSPHLDSSEEISNLWTNLFVPACRRSRCGVISLHFKPGSGTES
jgi:hypothetical protein